MELRPGVLIAERYRVERVLLADGGGTLLATWMVHNGSPVVVKVLPSSASPAQLINRFSRAQEIDSPHVPKLLELGGLDDGRTFIAMEYLEGDTLKARLARGPLPISEVVDAALQACHAIAAAHQVGVVHRRLKTSKLFQARTAMGSSEIKILGFATSSLADDTKVGDLPDDVEYLAPEQLTGVKNGKPSADIWALGVIFYELLTGRLPFTGRTRKAVAKRVLGDEPKRPRSIRVELPWQLEQAVLRCLEKVPSSRTESVRALVSELEPFASASRAGPALAERKLGDPSRAGVTSSSPPSDLPELTKLSHLPPGATSAEQTAAFHRLRSDGQIERIKVDEVAVMARARRVEEEAVRLEQAARRQGGLSLPPPARDTRSGAPANATRRIVVALIVGAVVLGLGSGLLVHLLHPGR